MRKTLLTLATLTALAGLPTCAAVAGAHLHGGFGGSPAPVGLGGSFGSAGGSPRPVGLGGSFGSGGGSPRPVGLGGASGAGGRTSSADPEGIRKGNNYGRGWCYWHPYSCYRFGASGAAIQ